MTAGRSQPRLLCALFGRRSGGAVAALALRLVTAENHDPVDRLLAAVESIRRRVIVADDAAATLEPFHVHRVWNISGDPDQQDEDDADGEREAQIVVGIFGPLRPCAERLRSDQ